ncbi:hypothetical protein Enr13x_47670 [Stieleria neptunia]|uniref:Uncharacterized protein n=1 Tax=Stieleria neptunia TaxID=2527979 RepID=A0A518HVM1_9BACT|nr:hypothetical protein Enr13x_47670 [Stieleria neptunia]
MAASVASPPHQRWVVSPVRDVASFHVVVRIIRILVETLARPREAGPSFAHFGDRNHKAMT